MPCCTSPVQPGQRDIWHRGAHVGQHITLGNSCAKDCTTPGFAGHNLIIIDFQGSEQQPLQRPCKVGGLAVAHCQGHGCAILALLQQAPQQAGQHWLGFRQGVEAGEGGPRGELLAAGNPLGHPCKRTCDCEKQCLFQQLVYTSEVEGWLAAVIMQPEETLMA